MKKKSKTHRFVEKNIVGLVAIIIAVVLGVLPFYFPTTVVILENQPNTPTVVQAQWHSVETWSVVLETSGTPTPQTLHLIDRNS